MARSEWATMAVVAALLVVLVREQLSPAVAVVGAAVVLVLADVLGAEVAFAGFASTTVATVGALYVVAGAVSRSGMLTRLLGRLLNQPDRSRRTLLRLIAPAAGLSAFLNNTPIVAALAPAVHGWSARQRLPASRWLMPLSYGTILGGVVTTIGTSTNLVVSGLMVEHGLEGFEMFELTPIGLPLAVAGIGLMVLLAPRVLPDRRSPAEQVLESPRGYSADLVVRAGGPIEGRTIADAGLRDLEGLYLATVERRGRVAPAAATDVLAGGDVLSFVGASETIVDLMDRPGLASREEGHLSALAGESGHAEVVIGPGSTLVNRTLKQARFRERYDAAVLAIHRDGEPLPGKLGTKPLRIGDALLVLCDNGFQERWSGRDDFAIIATLGVPDQTGDRRRAVVSIGVLFAMVAVVASGLMPILEAALAAALLLVLAGGLTIPEAREAIDLDVLLIVGGSFALGAAIETSGLATRAADLVGTAAGGGRLLAAVAVVGATMLLTEPLSNAAAAALMLPIGLEVAERMDGDPRVFAVAVAIAASASFLTPIGYQTNTMVYGLGGYRFTDYARLGGALTVVSLAIVTAGVLLLAW